MSHDDSGPHPNDEELFGQSHPDAEQITFESRRITQGDALQFRAKRITPDRATTIPGEASVARDRMLHESVMTLHPQDVSISILTTNTPGTAYRHSASRAERLLPDAMFASKNRSPFTPSPRN